MKIAMIGQKGARDYGGIERHVEEISKRLVARGHEVTVYCRFHYTSGQRISRHQARAPAELEHEAPGHGHARRSLHDACAHAGLRPESLPRPRPLGVRLLAALGRDTDRGHGARARLAAREVGGRGVVGAPALRGAGGALPRPDDRRVEDARDLLPRSSPPGDRLHPERHPPSGAPPGASLGRVRARTRQVRAVRRPPGAREGRPLPDRGLPERAQRHEARPRGRHVLHRGLRERAAQAAVGSRAHARLRVRRAARGIVVERLCRGAAVHHGRALDLTARGDVLRSLRAALGHPREPRGRRGLRGLVPQRATSRTSRRSCST